MRRRVVRPARHVLLLVCLLALPLAILIGRLDDRAQASVLHIVMSFAALMLAFRVIGKRELGRLSPFELVTLMLIPEILSGAVQGEDALLQGITGLCTILLLVLSTSLLSQRFHTVQHWLEPSPTVLVAEGTLLEQNMNAERIAPEELLSEMRKQGIANLRDVRFAVLEGGGNITFIPRSAPKQGHAAQDEQAAGF